MTESVPTNLNRMTNALVHGDETAVRAYRERGLDGLIEAFGLNAGEQAAIKDFSPDKLGAIGMPPILQLLLLIETNDHVRDHLCITAHMQRFQNEIGIKGDG